MLVFDSAEVGIPGPRVVQVCTAMAFPVSSSFISPLQDVRESRKLRFLGIATLNL